MQQKTPLISILLFVGFFFHLLITPSCRSFRFKEAPDESAHQTDINRAVVIGFHPALQPGESARVMRGAFSGAVFSAEPVPQEKVDFLTQRLFKELIEAGSYELISPGQARGAFASLLSENMSARDLEIYPKIGKAFSAEVIVMGYLYRWREREGTDYAVNAPASVAFDLYLIQSENGRIIWRGRFDKAQRSLTENLLDMKTFIRGGGKWMTAGDLAEIGLLELLKKMPENQKGKED